jgi:hypothetical protein
MAKLLGYSVENSRGAGQSAPEVLFFRLLAADDLPETVYEFEVDFEGCGHGFEGQIQNLPLLILTLNFMQNCFDQNPGIARRPGAETKRLVQ